MQYVTFTKENGNLVVTLTPEGKQEIAEAIADEKNIGSDDFMLNLFEHPLCNGWSEIRPEDIGALTSSPIFSDEATFDDDGNLKSVGRVYWFPNYQIESPVETLNEYGRVIFTGEEQ